MNTVRKTLKHPIVIKRTQRFHTLCFTFLVFLTTSLTGQDLLFFQYQETPLYLNPSLTGSFDGDNRFSSLLKRTRINSLFVPPSNTNYFSIDSKSQFNDNHYYGVGVSALFTEVRNFEVRDKHFRVNAAYHYLPKGHDKYSHQLSIGVLLGLSKIRFNSQSALEFIDPGIGVSWKKRSVNNYNFSLGLSFQGTNKVFNVFTLEDRQDVLTNLHADIEIPILRDWILVPDLLISFQSSIQNILIGTHFKRYLGFKGRIEYFQIGLQAWRESNGLHHTVQNFVVSTKLSINQLTVGLSLLKINSRSGTGFSDVELSFSYIFS